MKGQGEHDPLSPGCTPRFIGRVLCLFLQNHGNGSLGTDESADTTPFAVVVVDHNPPRFRIPRDAEIRAEKGTHIASLTRLGSETAAGLGNGLVCDSLFLGGTGSLALLRDPQGDAFSLLSLDLTVCHCSPWF
jgi:hypothetical protein